MLKLATTFQADSSFKACQIGSSSILWWPLHVHDTIQVNIIDYIFFDKQDCLSVRSFSGCRTFRLIHIASRSLMHAACVQLNIGDLRIMSVYHKLLLFIYNMISLFSVFKVIYCLIFLIMRRRVKLNHFSLCVISYITNGCYGYLRLHLLITTQTSIVVSNSCGTFIDNDNRWNAKLLITKLFPINDNIQRQIIIIALPSWIKISDSKFSNFSLMLNYRCFLLSVFSV